MRTFKVAILDLYDGVPNEGMRCIKALLVEFYTTINQEPQYSIFDIRKLDNFPNLNEFDAFISTGGPGSPILEGLVWEKKYFQFISDLLEHNANNEKKKELFAICHSFQMLFQYFKLGEITKRKSTSFGVMPIHMINEGESEPIFKGLDEPFWSVDSRDFQALQPNFERFSELGAKILCLEKERPQIPLERAIMAIRFTSEIFGTQFHPEADAEGMQRLFETEEKKKSVIENFGEEKYFEMLNSLGDPEKIALTEKTILPNFLHQAYAKFQQFQ